MMKKMAAVSMPSVKKENIFKKTPSPPCAKDKPSKRLVIHIGHTLSMKSEANPNVQTTIRDDFLFSLSSSS